MDYSITEYELLDLKEDFCMNKEKDLYEFIDDDPLKAFYLGMYIKQWFELIDKEQQYLYSKQVRHSKEQIENYLPQLKFWSSKFMEGKEDEGNAADMFVYILNNMFWENEKKDPAKLAFYLGTCLELLDKEEDE